MSLQLIGPVASLWRMVACLGLCSSLLATLLPLPGQAAETLRIAEQHGIVYLLLDIVRDQQLIEKQGRAAGLEIRVDWVRLSGGPAMNDALLSGSIDIAGAGIGPLLTVWDRTLGRRNVRALASLGLFPYYLLSSNPRVRSIADLGPADRIALPAVGVSVQARLLQYAAARAWGDQAASRLDPYTVAVPHPEAAAALVSGGTELNGHFSVPPFQNQELQNPAVHVVLDSYDLLGPNSPALLYATERFRQEHPAVCQVFLAALEEAARLAQSDRAAAARIYRRAAGPETDPVLLKAVLDDPRIEFSIVPRNTWPLADFLSRTGVLKNRPHSWQDYFFTDPRIADGS